MKDYHWSTNSNMYVNNKTGTPSREVTQLYNTLIAEESAPRKNPQLEFYNEMLRTGKHPTTGKKLTSAEKTSAQLMIYGLIAQPFVGAVAASKLPAKNTSSGGSSGKSATGNSAQKAGGVGNKANSGAVSKNGGGISNPVDVLGKGNTGRTKPNNLNEQIAMY